MRRLSKRFGETHKQMPRTYKNLRRLYVTGDLATGVELPLDKAQSHYLVNVLRKKPGEPVIVFNGREGAFLAEIREAGKKLATLSLGEQTAEQTAPNDLWYGFAPLKSARLDYVIQKATEMGVGTIQPVITQYTQVSKLKTDRMEANAIEAAEQCEVLSVPEILPETGLKDLLANWQRDHHNRALILADEGEGPASPRDILARAAAGRYGLLIGPEGGFSEEERSLLRAQDFVIPISLGPRVLRADTAAVAALTLIQTFIGDWR